MSRVSRALPHLSAALVKQKFRTAKNFWQQQKWLVIYNALVDPQEAKEIAKHTGVSTSTVHQVISEYNRYGERAIETPGRGGRRSSYLSLAAEGEFLAPFIAQAKLGKISTTATIQSAFEQQLGERVAPSTIYRLLERHQWHKVVPRPHHPQADLAAQAAFKQTFPSR
jgi:transposase